MINRVIFPQNECTKYYAVHYQYLLNTLLAAGIPVEFGPPTALDQTRFVVQVDGKKVIVDFSDHYQLHDVHQNARYYLKYHYSEGVHERNTNVFPIGPISFYNWEVYDSLRREITYTAGGNCVLNNQRPGGAATRRRKRVQSILLKEYGGDVDFEFGGGTKGQVVFWRKMSNCLVSVCVPGARNDILDRGQFQYMAFGACTLSPKLNTMLAFNRKLVPGVHYVECKSDYTDLIARIEWCKGHRDECRRIGASVKSLFRETSIPKKLWEWIGQVVGT